jgi:hypothetical protein
MDASVPDTMYAANADELDVRPYRIPTTTIYSAVQLTNSEREIFWRSVRRV